MANYQTLEVWKKGMALVKDIYQFTKILPKEEMFGLTSQLKRAAVSVPANIAEGMGRQHKKDCIHFMHIARGSLYELETLLLICQDAFSIEQEKVNALQSTIIECMKQLNGFINYLEKADLK